MLRFVAACSVLVLACQSSFHEDGVDATADVAVDDPQCRLAADCVGIVVPASPCEAPSCAPVSGTCVLIPLADATPCEDGDLCTEADGCAEGRCDAGPAITCDDDDPCTHDTCDPDSGCVFTAHVTACDDGDACTVDDVCADGDCHGAPVTCDDDDPCTDDACDTADGCVSTPNTAPCDDGDACTVNDGCHDGACQGTPLDCDDGDPCTQDDFCGPDGDCLGVSIACDDGNPCTDDSCSDGDCAFVPNAAPCDDGDACTVNHSCSAGACSGIPLDCDDGNDCTDDACAPGTGCVHDLGIGGPCDDGVDCTVDTFCLEGACVAAASVCDCTEDSDCAQYEDGDPCTGTLYCDTSDFPWGCKVKPSSIVVCPPAAEPCLTNQCVSETGDCALVPTAGPCDDGDLCTTLDACSDGSCLGGAAADCDDGQECTEDSCDTADGCLHVPLADADCDDDNPCTTDTCADAGCVHLPIESLCDDGDLCTVDDACTAGQCVGSPGADCDDGNPCTADACDADTGCSNTPKSGSCVATDPCKPDGFCTNGVCLAGPDLDCNDFDVCTEDACDGGLCTHVALTGPCDDDQACTQNDTCTAAGCVGVKDACDDGDPCTDDACSDLLGCLNTPNGSCGPCVGLDCLPCGNGSACADDGPWLDDTCCAEGDALVYLSSATGHELVDIETNGTWTFGCGGFGMHATLSANPAQPSWKGSWLSRCQRVAFGPALSPTTTAVYFSHHGDTWVPTPFIATFHAGNDGAISQVQTIEGPNLYEGMVWDKGRLYSAQHSGGVEIFTTDAAGLLTPHSTIGGFANAWKPAVADDWLYVADGEGGLKVVSLSSEAIVSAVETAGLARDVDVDGDRLFVALGGGGVESYDRTTTPPTLLGTLDSEGSAQAVAAREGILAVAEWTQLSLYDQATLTRLGSEQVKLYPDVVQVFGVALHDGIAHVAEWEGMHFVQYAPGRVAPDLWVGKELIDFGVGDTTKGLLVKNRGHLPLVVSSITADPPAVFSPDQTTLDVEPGAAAFLEVNYQPPAAGQKVLGTLVFETNDPDSGQSPFVMHLQAGGSTTALKVGDSITNAWGYLDPSGANDVEALKGNVLVLAYFALF